MWSIENPSVMVHKINVFRITNSWFQILHMHVCTVTIFASQEFSINSMGGGIDQKPKQKIHEPLYSKTNLKAFKSYVLIIRMWGFFFYLINISSFFFCMATTCGIYFEDCCMCLYCTYCVSSRLHNAYEPTFDN